MSYRGGGSDRRTEIGNDESGDTPYADRRTFLKGSAATLGGVAVAGETAATEISQADRGASDVATAQGPEMVASVHPQATRAGAEVLEAGGNAVDAAVAVQFALNVVQPQSSGIGGGGFMLVYDADEDVVYAVDNRERAPLGATPDMFLNEQGEPIPFEQRHTSGQAVGVPGTLRAADVALKRFGTRSLPDLVEPAIELAAPGAREVTVDALLAEAIADNQEQFNDAAREVFAPDGSPLQEGDRLVQPDLAETFRRIRDRGVGAFYKGDIAESIADTVQDTGGTMTVDDLASYNVTIDHPEVVEFGDVTVRTMSLPSSGGLTIGQILKLVEPFDVGQYGPQSFERYHAILEAANLAFADRGAFMGDKQFVDAPWQGLLADDYLSRRRGLISFDRAGSPGEPGSPWEFQPGGPYRVRPVARGITTGQLVQLAQSRLSAADVDVESVEELVSCVEGCLGRAFSERTAEATYEVPRRRTARRVARPRPFANRGQTTHFTTADSEGNLVSWTSTIEQFFGTKLMVPGRGFMLNNELTDFDATPGGPNEVQPNKRPLSSTSPTIVFRDAEPFMTLGSPGGPTIITTVAQVLLNVVEFGMSLQTAIAQPRVYEDADPEVFWEEGVPANVRDELQQRGHQLQSDPTELGNVQAILVQEPGQYLGASDFRREGAVVSGG